MSSLFESKSDKIKRLVGCAKYKELKSMLELQPVYAPFTFSQLCGDWEEEEEDRKLFQYLISFDLSDSVIMNGICELVSSPFLFFAVLPAVKKELYFELFALAVVADQKKIYDCLQPHLPSTLNLEQSLSMLDRAIVHYQRHDDEFLMTEKSLSLLLPLLHPHMENSCIKDRLNFLRQRIGE